MRRTGLENPPRFLCLCRSEASLRNFRLGSGMLAAPVSAVGNGGREMFSERVIRQDMPVFGHAALIVNLRAGVVLFRLRVIGLIRLRIGQGEMR
jgi:hypothetical protein